ncbi:MAG: hypothetical protein C0601_05930 [Candidatus Muiribacterium halophilum]|uniref:C-methyltransferase domain-containing protein n=1 Tax=Muiribacterium halophilum TaxID=2053465 RepID=A0A2N5ZH00_MUIH1|nr:MAG: hypothetical protein C0601_05930 [Candidatus Muirbacterium halophilum]
MFYKDQDLKFLKPAPLLRELSILSQLEKEPNTSQQRLSRITGISVSMVNRYISNFSDDKVINIKGKTNRNTKYLLTVKGQEYKRRLLISYMIETVKLYKDAKSEFALKFRELSLKGVKKIVFYGAGETAEIAIPAAVESGFKVIALVDQKKEKQGQVVGGILVVSPSMLDTMDYDAIIISSYGYTNEIYTRVSKYKKKDKIILKL